MYYYMHGRKPMEEYMIDLPGWEVVRCIGSGSSGKVYELKKNDKYGGDFHSALKVISIPSTQQEYDEMTRTMSEYAMRAKLRDKVENISNEYRLMGVLKGHPNIVNCEDTMIVPHTEDIGWDVYIRMELLTSLPDYVHENGLTIAQVIKIGTDICSALELCRQNGIIHRDIKPQNIFVSKYGDFKLGDFGVAKEENIRGAADKVGTYAYMAPEVYKNKAYDESVDIYSLGMVLYWLLNDRRGPFLPLSGDHTSQQTADAQLRRFRGEALPAPKNGNAALKKVVLKACAYNREERFTSPTEFKQALNLAAAGKLYQAAREIDDEATVREEAPVRPQTTQPISVPKQPVQTHPKPVPRPAPVYKPAAPVARVEEDEDEHGHKGGLVGVVVLLVLLIAVMVTVLIFYFGSHSRPSGGHDNDSKPSTVQTEKPEETTKISSLMINYPQLSIVEGDTEQLVVDFVPDLAPNEKAPELVWKSSAENIVTVDEDGEVEGVKAGTATIRVYVKDKIELSAECLVTVKEPVLERIDIESSPDRLVYNYGDTIDLTGLVIRAYYSNDTVERITDTAAVSVQYDFKTLGPTTVTVTYQGQSATFDARVNLF